MKQRNITNLIRVRKKYGGKIKRITLFFIDTQGKACYLYRAFCEGKSLTVGL